MNTATQEGTARVAVSNTNLTARERTLSVLSRYLDDTDLAPTEREAAAMTRIANSWLDLFIDRWDETSLIGTSGSGLTM